MTATILVLLIGKWFRIISFPKLTKDTARKIWPLPLFYIGNMLFGLGGTQELSLPMMTVLRRFSILMTMIGEFYILKVNPQLKVQLSVYLMILGAIIAACNDLAFSLKVGMEKFYEHSVFKNVFYDCLFDFQGYTFILLNDFCTAANGVCTKQKLDAKDLGNVPIECNFSDKYKLIRAFYVFPGKYGLLFYNSLFMWVPTLLLTIYTGDIRAVAQFEHWTLDFCLEFLLSCIFGFILMYATVLCTQCNSALTTTIVGCLKNVFVTYLGMVIGGDYIFSWPNFIGLNISVIGSLVYTKVTFSTKQKTVPSLPSEVKSDTKATQDKA